jgi:hypothetical protein
MKQGLLRERIIRLTVDSSIFVDKRARASALAS